MNGVRGTAADCFDVLGYVFNFETSSSTARRWINGIYSDHGVPAARRAAPTFSLNKPRNPAGPAVWKLQLGDELLDSDPSFWVALAVAEFEICKRIIAHREDLMMIHGATVVGPRGSALIVGASEAGKSTLALALASRGYQVASDDATLLDPRTGTTRPVVRCFRVDPRSRRMLRRLGLSIPRTRYSFPTPADLGFAPTPARPFRQVIVLTPGPTRGRPTLAPLIQADAVGRLLPHVSWGSHAMQDLVAGVSRLLAGASCYHLTRGGIALTVDRVARLLESS